jgi:hypothetical protein
MPGRCRSSAPCDERGGHGHFGSFCAVHAAELEAIISGARREASPPVTPATGRRSKIDRRELADRLVALVNATPLDELPLTRSRATVALDAGDRAISDAANIAIRAGRLRRTQGFVPIDYESRRAVVAVKAHPGLSAAQLATEVRTAATPLRAALADAEAAGQVRKVDGSWFPIAADAPEAIAA